MDREKSCGTIVFRKHGNSMKFLLLHYFAGHWDFPKGHVEKGETEEATALRELEEETGIAGARLLPGFREKITYYYKRKNETVFKQVIFFLAEARQEDVKLSSEHKGFKWLLFNDAMKTLTFKNAKGVLGKASEFLEQATLAYGRE